jgi:hypothetical protein
VPLAAQPPSRLARAPPSLRATGHTRCVPWRIPGNAVNATLPQRCTLGPPHPVRAGGHCRRPFQPLSSSVGRHAAQRRSVAPPAEDPAMRLPLRPLRRRAPLPSHRNTAPSTGAQSHVKHSTNARTRHFVRHAARDPLAPPPGRAQERGLSRVRAQAVRGGAVHVCVRLHAASHGPRVAARADGRRRAERGLWGQRLAIAQPRAARAATARPAARLLGPPHPPPMQMTRGTPASSAVLYTWGSGRRVRGSHAGPPAAVTAAGTAAVTAAVTAAGRATGRAAPCSRRPRTRHLRTPTTRLIPKARVSD